MFDLYRAEDLIEQQEVLLTLIEIVTTTPTK